MNLQQRVKIAAQALTGKTENSLGTSEANKFLRYGSGQKPLTQNWSEVKMSDEDMYTGYSYAAIVKRANRTSVLGRRFILTEASAKTVDEYQKREEDLIHPYLKVVNRSKDFTKKQFWYEISTYLDLEGVYYLGTVRNSRTKTNGEVTVGAVQKFVLINPYEMRKVIKESTGEVGGYVESHNGFYREWAPQEIIEIRMLNPFDKTKAYAMTDAAKESQFTLKQAGDYTRQTINGNISSPGVVSTEVLLDDQKFENFKARVTGKQKGEPIFANGAGAIRWQDMQIDLDKAALDKINDIQSKILFAVSGTGKTVLGIEESGTTRDTSQTQDENFTVDAIIPRVEDICDALNLDYRRYYDEWEENEFEIVVDSPVESDRESEIKDIEIRDSAYELAKKLIADGYEREAAFKYANGEISWEELGEPKEVETEEVETPKDAPKNDDTDEDGITDKDEDTDEPKDGASPGGSGGGKLEENSLRGKVLNQIASRDYPELYDDIDIDTDDLGCIMLNLEPMKVLEHVKGLEDEVFENPKFDQGAIPAETVPHVTLLYGLLENGNKWKDKVDLLLKDWKLESVKIDHVGFFETPDSYAIVAHLEKTDELVDGHERLTLLPHVNTFSEYLPHMTLAYVKLEANPEPWVKALGKVYNGKTVKASGINYGDHEDKDDKTDNHVEDEHDMSKTSKKKIVLDKDSSDMVADDALGHALSSVGQEHNSLSASGLIVAYNALDGDTRDIIQQQEVRLRNGFATVERQIVEIAAQAVENNKDIIPKEDRKKFEQEVAVMLNTFYINLYPIFGRQLMAKRATEYGELATYEMTTEAQAYIEEMAAKAAESHVATVIKDLVAAMAIATAVVITAQLATLVLAAIAAGKASVVKKFPPNPTREQVIRVIEAGDMDNTALYREAQKYAEQGEGQAEIVRAIRNKYPEISKNRATTIARTESARVFNQSQFEADKQFLNSSGLMNRAYKQLRSRTGTPCVHCKALINKPAIPFMKNFADLGTTISATETKEDGTVKVKSLPINWEPVSAGNVHPNCNCEYVLIIKD